VRPMGVVVLNVDSEHVLEVRSFATAPTSGVGTSESPGGSAPRPVLWGHPKSVASQAPDLGQCENGITPFDCPRDNSLRCHGHASLIMHVEAFLMASQGSAARSWLLIREMSPRPRVAAASAGGSVGPAPEGLTAVSVAKASHGQGCSGGPRRRPLLAEVAADLGRHLDKGQKGQRQPAFGMPGDPEPAGRGRGSDGDDGHVGVVLVHRITTAFRGA
jgi:hypothetical protein